MELRAAEVGKVVVVTAIVVDGPEHSAEQVGVAGGFQQLVCCSCGSLACNDVLQRLAHYLRLSIARVKADCNLPAGHGRKGDLRIASNVESVQQELGHGSVIVDGAGLINLAI